MRILLFTLTLLLMMFSCKTILPEKSDEKSSCIVIQEDYIAGTNPGVAPSSIYVKIFNDEVSNEYEFNVRNILFIDKIKIGKFDKLKIFPIYTYGNLDATLDSYNHFTPISLITNENSIIIFPYRFLITNGYREIKIIKRKLEHKDIVNIILELEKAKNFNNYSKIYFGNKEITNNLDDIKNATLSNESVGKVPFRVKNH